MNSDCPPLRILVADDNVDAAAALRVLLELSGHVVMTVNDGESAVRAAMELRPDLGIFDIGMPKKNGYEAAKIVRQNCPSTILVAVTGWGQPRDVARAYESGFHRHFTKPVAFADLEAVIDRIQGVTGGRDEA